MKSSWMLAALAGAAFSLGAVETAPIFSDFMVLHILHALILLVKKHSFILF